jgi:hypothetical protein
MVLWLFKGDSKIAFSSAVEIAYSTLLDSLHEHQTALRPTQQSYLPLNEGGWSFHLRRESSAWVLASHNRDMSEVY